MVAMLECPTVPQVLDLPKIRERRKELGLGLAEAAAAAGIPGGASSWSDIESGRRGNLRIDTLLKIATALDLDVRDLFADTPPRRARGSRGRAS